MYVDFTQTQDGKCPSPPKCDDMCPTVPAIVCATNPWSGDQKEFGSECEYKNYVCKFPGSGNNLLKYINLRSMTKENVFSVCRLE